MRAAPQTQNLLIKNCTFILTCLNFSHLQSALHLLQYTYWDVSSTAQNSEKKKILFIFRWEGERERNINVWLPLECSQLGTWSTAQACVLTGNWTTDPLVHRPTLNPLGYITRSKQFLNSLILMPFSASVIFCFTSSTSAKHFPLRTFFIWGNKKKCPLGRDWVNRESGAWGHAVFWLKTPEHSAWCEQVCS